LHEKNCLGRELSISSRIVIHEVVKINQIVEIFYHDPPDMMKVSRHIVGRLFAILTAAMSCAK
jgi:hypothetical protein